ESPIPFLPGKFETLLMCPSGGIRFDGKNHISQRQHCRYLDQPVKMIFHASNGMDKYLLILAYACNVVPHAWLEFSGNHSLAFVRTEYNVNDILHICVRHVSHLRRSIIYGDAIFPALTDWANFFHA